MTAWNLSLVCIHWWYYIQGLRTWNHCIYLHSTLKVWSRSSSPLEAVLLINPHIYKRAAAQVYRNYVNKPLTEHNYFDLVVCWFSPVESQSIWEWCRCLIVHLKCWFIFWPQIEPFKGPIYERVDSLSLIPTLMLEDCGWLYLQSQSVCVWWVGNETQKCTFLQTGTFDDLRLCLIGH